LINAYCKNGLKKPDLVKKMEWVTGSCKMSWYRITANT
jgi:hypothetical protein